MNTLTKHIKPLIGKLIRRSSALSSMIDGVLVKSCMLDGVSRKVPHRLDAQFRLLKHHPDFSHESQRVYEAYPGGDLLDVGSFYGWYSAMLSSKAKAGSLFVSLEPSASAFPFTLETLADLKRAFPEIEYCALNVAAGNSNTGVKRNYPGGKGQHAAFFPGGESSDGIKCVRADDLVSSLGLRRMALR